MTICEYAGHETNEEVRRLPITEKRSIATCHKHWEWEMEARWRGQAQGRKNLGFVRWDNLKKYDTVIGVSF